MNKDIVREDIQIISDTIAKDAKKLEGKTLLISGGAGFLGSYILAVIQNLNEKVFSKKCTVISIDNYITGSPKGLIALKIDKNIHHIKHNIINPYKTRKKIDYIIHAAGIASPIYYRQSPLETIDVTVLGLRHLLELGRINKIKSFLYFSSSEIYGNPDSKNLPTSEAYKGNVSSIGPRSPYDESKRLGETICMAYSALYKFPVKIVRPFNVYGPGMKPTDYRVLPMFVSRGTTGKPLPVHANGEQTRTFCYVSDAISGFLKVFLSDKNGEVYNVGNDDIEISMLSLAQKIALILGKGTRIEKINYPASYPQDEPQRRFPDLSKIRKELAYNPKVNLDAGLKRFVLWYRDIYGIC